MPEAQVDGRGNRLALSVVVPTFNRKEMVQRTIRSLMAQHFSPLQFEIIVVVDGSTDGTAGALRALSSHPALRIVEQSNQGPSAARNAGFRAAASGLVLFVDDDMICDPELAAAHAAAHKGRQNAIAFGSIFLSADSRRTLAAECFRREIGALHLERQKNPEAGWQITDSVFSNTSLRRRILEEAGGFDEAFRKREDLELGVRLLAAGAIPVYASAARTFQCYEKNSSDLIREAEAFAEADVLLAAKYPSLSLNGHLGWFAREPRWKQLACRIAASVPWLGDWLLAPLCLIGEAGRSVPALLNIGVRALQLRRRIHWFHKVFQSGWRLPKPTLRTNA